MHLLAFNQKVLADCVVVVLPERVGIVANVTEERVGLVNGYATRGEWER